MSLLKITITTMKFAFFLLSLYALLGTHHARTLNGDVIQMVIEALEFQSLDQTTYGRVPGTPPSPSVAPSRGQETFGRDKPKAPPSPSVAPARGVGTYGRVKPKAPPTPSVAPSRGQETFGRDKPKAPPTPSVAPARGEGTYRQVKPKAPPTPSVAPSRGEGTYKQVKPKAPPTPSVAPSRGEGTYGRVKPKTPPSPSVAPSRGETTYGGNNPDSKSPTTYNKDTNEPTACVGDVIEMITGEQEFQSLDQTTYGRVRKTPTSPSVAPSRGQETFGRVPKSPPTPSGAPSRGQGTYGRENPSSDSQTTNELTDSLATPSLKQDRFRDELATYVRDNFITTRPLSNDLTRVAPRAPTPPKPNVPSHPTTSESLCVDSENACSGLFTSV